MQNTSLSEKFPPIVEYAHESVAALQTRRNKTETLSYTGKVEHFVAHALGNFHEILFISFPCVIPTASFMK